MRRRWCAPLGEAVFEVIEQEPHRLRELSRDRPKACGADHRRLG